MFRSNLVPWHDLSFVPFKLIRDLENEMTGRYEEGSEKDGKKYYTPNYYVDETEKEYLYFVELPGMTKEKMKIEFLEDMITISGERDYDGKNFKMRFRVPKVAKEEAINANLTNGLLTLKVLKSVKEGPKVIEIFDSEPSIN